MVRVVALLVSGWAFILGGVFSERADAQTKGVMQDWSRRQAFVDPFLAQKDITGAWQGGNWGSQALQGLFRFVVTKSDSGKGNHLYVQWLNGGDQAEEVFYSISIEELNSLARYRFGLPACVDNSCQHITLQAYDIFEDKQLEFSLLLEGVGQYRMKI